MSDGSGRKRGDARMRELGCTKVSFWVSEEERTLLHRALGCYGGRPGRKAYELLLAWAREQPTPAELARGAKRESGVREIDG